MLMGNLLVVDWDYFFNNPLESGRNVDEKWVLYDWGHREDMSFMLDAVWGSRAQGFTRNDLPLPQMDQRWRQFPERFRLHEDTIIRFADSNLWAGSQRAVGDDFESVWLFDAHHDLYKAESVDEWLSKMGDEDGNVKISCEDWMFWHKHCGSELVWRFPDWHDSWNKVKYDPDVEDNLTVAKNVGLDWAVDDWKPVEDVEFDHVFICRSGAWVPPWCDDEFDQFVQSWDRDSEQVGPNVDMTRNDWKGLVSLDLG